MICIFSNKRVLESLDKLSTMDWVLRLRKLLFLKEDSLKMVLEAAQFSRLPFYVKIRQFCNKQSTLHEYSMSPKLITGFSRSAYQVIRKLI